MSNSGDPARTRRLSQSRQEHGCARTDDDQGELRVFDTFTHPNAQGVLVVEIIVERILGTSKRQNVDGRQTHDENVSLEVYTSDRSS